MILRNAMDHSPAPAPSPHSGSAGTVPLGSWLIAAVAAHRACLPREHLLGFPSPAPPPVPFGGRDAALAWIRRHGEALVDWCRRPKPGQPGQVWRLAEPVAALLRLDGQHGLALDAEISAAADARADHHPYQGLALARQALSHLEQGDHQFAVRRARAALALADDRATRWPCRIRWAIYASAHRVLARAYASAPVPHPRDGARPAQLDTALRHANEALAAAKHAEIVGAIRGDEVAACHADLADLHTLRGDTRAAHAALIRALRLAGGIRHTTGDPLPFAWILYRRARCLHRLGQHREALAALRIVLPRLADGRCPHPWRVGVHATLGAVLRVLGDRPGAERAYRHAAALAYAAGHHDEASRLGLAAAFYGRRIQSHVDVPVTPPSPVAERDPAPVTALPTRTARSPLPEEMAS